MRIVKRKKSSRYKGRGMGTSGTGARKNKRKSGNKGGTGMSGTGKRSDQIKTKILKLYGNKYFGKQGVTSKKTKRDKRRRINLSDIMINLEKYGKKGKNGWEVVLKKYKILGKGEIKEKIFLTCLEASASAIKKVEAAGGSVDVKEIKVIETPKVSNPKHDKKKGNN